MPGASGEAGVDRSDATLGDGGTFVIHRTWRQPGAIGRCLLVIVAGMAASVAASRSLEAQTATATLSGIVVDESGGALPDVQVIAANAATGLQRQATSDAEGALLDADAAAGQLFGDRERAGLRAGAGEGPAAERKRRGDDQARAQGRGATTRRCRCRCRPRLVETAAPSTIEVSPLEVRSVAGAGENIYHVLQTLPGVAAVNDFDSRLSVRGGGPDQNLTMMDGVEIHNPYRLFGLTSAFNPETVESFELTAGGFNAKYGDRLSSILVIENRAGTEQQRLAGSANLAFTDANLVTEGKLPGGASGSWLVTGRRTYYDLIAEPLVGTDLPGFTDLQAKAVWSPRPGQRLTLFGLSSRESTDADDRRRHRRREAAAARRARTTTSPPLSFSSPIGTAGVEQDDRLLVPQSRGARLRRHLQDGARRSNRPDDDAQPFAEHRLHAQRGGARRRGAPGDDDQGVRRRTCSRPASRATRCRPAGAGRSPATAIPTKRTDPARSAAPGCHRCSTRRDRPGAPARG